MVDLRTVLSRLQNQTTAAKSQQKNSTSVFLLYRQTERWIKHENVHAWLVSSHNVLIFYGALLEFQSCKCSLSLLILVALLFCANMSTDYVHVKYKCRCLMPHMEIIWAQMDISSYILYCYHKTCSVKVLSGTLVAQTWWYSACNALIRHLDSQLLCQFCTKWGNAIKSKQGNQEPSFTNINMALFFTPKSIVL